VQQQIEELIEQHEGDGEQLLESLNRSGLIKLLTEAVAEEVKQFLGRDHYQRLEEGQEHKGYRNGYRDKSFRTAEGAVRVPIPRLRDTSEPFQSRLLGSLGRQTDRLGRMVIEMYVRGLSTRDIEALLRDEEGNLLLSRSAVSDLSAKLWEEYEQFAKADLSEHEVEYLWLDAVYEPMRRHLSGREGILAAWAVTRCGQKVLLGLDIGPRESRSAWQEFIHGLVRRGLREPALVISDGNPGLLAAVEASFPNSWRQRCTFHKKRNVLSKVPQGAERDEVELWLANIYTAPTHEVGSRLAAEFIETFGSRYPRAVSSFEDDLEASLTHLRFPLNHRRGIRTSNSIERLFGEQRRRTKVIPMFFDERSCLKLVFASLIRAARGFRRFEMSDLSTAQLEHLRREKKLDSKPSLDYELARKVNEVA
jgi:transposase-like protein